MTPYLQGIIDNISSKMSHDDIHDYFGDKCYMAKSNFSEIVEYFIENTDFDILYSIFTSTHFKKNNDLRDSYNEPIIHSIMYAIYAIVTMEKEDWTEAKKMELKEGFIKLLTDVSIPFQWNMTDYNIDNPMHLVLTHWECYTLGEILTILSLANQNGVSPLNRNDVDCNAFDVLFSYDEMPEEFKEQIMAVLSPMCDDQILEIPTITYAEV